MEVARPIKVVMGYLTSYSGHADYSDYYDSSYSLYLDYLGYQIIREMNIFLEFLVLTKL